MPPLPDLASGARAILDAATIAFARAGFDSVSIADIAAQAGVSKANIFHHFKSKEALHQGVLREACKGHAEFAEALLARTDMGSVDKLRALIRFDFADAFANELNTHLVVREVLNTGCCAGRDLVEPVFMRNIDAVVGIIRQGQKNGAFAADIDPSTVTLMIGATVMLFFQNRQILDRFPGLQAGADPDTYADLVFRTVLGGVIAAPRTPATMPAKKATKPKARTGTRRKPRTPGSTATKTRPKT
ncbi:MAG: TetR/AcrR family transcriptional regulator [Gammaproteobacteria bacterium]|nr:TetR/AcrR family transcriptional regulator [Gammaproteobacteria bacterium]